MNFIKIESKFGKRYGLMHHFHVFSKNSCRIICCVIILKDNVKPRFTDQRLLCLAEVIDVLQDRLLSFGSWLSRTFLASLANRSLVNLSTFEPLRITPMSYSEIDIIEEIREFAQLTLGGNWFVSSRTAGRLHAVFDLHITMI
jgi:hypothetical protein